MSKYKFSVYIAIINILVFNISMKAGDKIGKVEQQPCFYFKYLFTLTCCTRLFWL